MDWEEQMEGQIWDLKLQVAGLSKMLKEISCFPATYPATNMLQSDTSQYAPNMHLGWSPSGIIVSQEPHLVPQKTVNQDPILGTPTSGELPPGLHAYVRSNVQSTSQDSRVETATHGGDNRVSSADPEPLLGGNSQDPHPSSDDDTIKQDCDIISQLSSAVI